jgi:hypothetical protein
MPNGRFSLTVSVSHPGQTDQGLGLNKPIICQLGGCQGSLVIRFGAGIQPHLKIEVP